LQAEAEGDLTAAAGLACKIDARKAGFCELSVYEGRADAQRRRRGRGEERQTVDGLYKAEISAVRLLCHP